MGILKEPVEFVEALKLPKGFSVCELGDQWVTYGTPHVLASDWYKRIGCGRYESIDGNDRGTWTHDLNRKLPAAVAPFDLVTDFGTGEHIFDQAQVWRTIHLLTKPGGYIAFDRPTAGYPGHCFYLINEGLIRDIAAANDYAILRLEPRKTSRGELIRGVFKKTGTATKFQVPQQGRYRSILGAIL